MAHAPVALLPSRPRRLTMRDMRIRLQWPGLKVLVLVLAVAAVAAVALPPAWLNRWRAGGGVLASAATWAYQMSVAARAAWARALDREPPPGQAEYDRATITDLHNRLVFVHQQNQDLTHRVEDLTRIRNVVGAELGQLVPAVVTGAATGGRRDVLFLRPTASLTTGTLRSGDWVVAAPPPLDRPREAGRTTGLTKLAGCFAIGVVEDVQPLLVRVRLFSDPVGTRRVSIVRLQDTKMVTLERNVLLEGLGDGRLHIRDLKRTTQATERDWVVAEPSSQGPPVGLMIGRVTRLAEQPRQRIVVTADVEPVSPYREMSLVYVLCPRAQ